jgi:hypothetical protein
VKEDDEGGEGDGEERREGREEREGRREIAIKSHSGSFGAFIIKKCKKNHYVEGYCNLQSTNQSKRKKFFLSSPAYNNLHTRYGEGTKKRPTAAERGWKNRHCHARFKSAHG